MGRRRQRASGRKARRENFARSPRAHKKARRQALAGSVPVRLADRAAKAVTEEARPPKRPVSTAKARGDEPGQERLGQRRPASVSRAPTSRALWQVYGCTGLCALGTTAGLAWLSGELGYQVSGSGAGGLIACAVCIGVLLGLWLPRRWVRRSVARGLATPDEGAESELAASIAGFVVLGLGVLWLLLIGAAAATESYREFLFHNFVFPPWLTRILLLIPLALGLAIAGAVGATAMMTLQGWFRVVNERGVSVSRLWLVSLLAAAVGGTIASLVSSPIVPAVIGLVAVFLAGVVAAMRGWSAEPVRDATPPARSDRVRDIMPLLVVGTAALSCGAALLLTWPREHASSPAVGARVALLAVAAAIGLLLGKRPSPDRSYAVAPFVLLLSAITWIVPFESLIPEYWSPALARMAVTTCCAAACAALVARRMGGSHGTIQSGFAAVGAAAAIGFGSGICTVFVFAQQSAASASPVLVALGITGVAGLVLVLQRPLRLWTRVVGLGAVALWFLLIPRVPTGLDVAPVAPHAAAAEADRNPTGIAVRKLYSSGEFRCLRVHVDRKDSGAGPQSAWEADLGGPRWDAVIVSAAGADDTPETADRAGIRRIVRRCAGALLDGGRLVVELPNPALTEAALEYVRARGGESGLSRAYLLRAWKKGVGGAAAGPFASSADYEALVVGADAPEWILDQTPPDGIDVALYPVHGKEDLRSVQLAANARR